MGYKAFQDYYKEAEIKHLLLHVHGDLLISPPFATDKCKDYSKVMVIDNTLISYIDLILPPATSKFNTSVSINDSVWFIPYGIWDDFNIVVELNNLKPIYHTIDKPGKGQFYSAATDGATAFSFPLGYEDTNFGIYIKDGKVITVDFDVSDHTKLHMGTVWCNNRYWSPPRSDEAGYANVVCYDGAMITTYKVNVSDPTITRKYSDFVVCGNTLYALPYGEQPGMTEVLEFDTVSGDHYLHKLTVPDFAKKYNCMVLLDEVIIGLPYGTEKEFNSNWGVSFNTVTKESTAFDIGKELAHGGKYRYRCGINYNGSAVFLPAGTPSCPVIKITKDLQISSIQLEHVMLGRPVLHNKKLKALGHHMIDKTLSLYTFEEDLTYTEVLL